MFGNACRKAFATRKAVFSDFEFYESSGNDAVGFFVHAVYDEDNERIGLIANCISIDEIDKFMQENTGLGETGESYLVGKDLLMRSNSRFASVSTILKEIIDTSATKEWLNGLNGKEKKGVVMDIKEASLYKDYRGIDVLGTYIGFEVTGVNLALMVEIDKNEAFSPVLRLRKIVIGLLILTMITVTIVAILITRYMVFPIKKLSDWARRVAKGDLGYDDISMAKNEIGRMSESFKEVVDSFRQVTEVCEAVAVGDFHKMLTIRSDNDRLGKSVNQMAKNLHEVVDQVNKVTGGDYTAEIVPRSDQDHLGEALSLMTKRLKEVNAENDRKNWLRSHRMELNDKMRGEQDLTTLGRNVVRSLAESVNANVGAIYIIDVDDEIFKLVGSYAFTKRKSITNGFKSGEGLVGQAVLEKQTIVVTNVPDDYIKINSGLGEAAPCNIIVIPLINDDRVIGVIELGAFTEFGDLQLEFFNLVAENIAIAISSAESRTVMVKLLEETQRQAEKLATQQEELRQTNEELEEQTMALKKSEEKLKFQQEELQQTNEELEEQTQELERQKNDVRIKNQALEVSKDELKRKADALELSSKYKSEFLANMSHELRTPLNSILILSKILGTNKDGNFTEKQVELATTINSSGTDLLTLINDILDLSKVESGNMKLNLEFVEFRDLFENIKRKFQPVVDEKGLER